MLKQRVKELANAMPALKKSKKAAASAADIAGEYTITLGDYYFQGSVGEFEDDCTVSAESGVVVFEPTQTLPFGGSLDEANGTVTFTTLGLGLVNFGEAGSYYVRQEPYIYSYDEEDIILQDFTATYADGAFSFPAESGISWVAYSDENYTQAYSYVDILDLLACVKNASDNDDDNTSWTSLGNATLMDGWVLPGLGFDQTDPANQYEVEIQQNNDNKNIYRLVDPYKGDSPAAAFNASTKTGYIQFDVTDPDHVVFDAVDAGFVNSDLDITKFYCINVLTSLMDYYDMTAAELISELGDVAPYTTFKNGVVSLGSVPGNNGTTVYDACFGDQTDKYAGYGWVDENENRTNMAAKIIFPETGIDNVVAGEADAPVKYFNLQGIEVAKPAAGQVVIRKQGNNATKFMAR